MLGYRSPHSNVFYLFILLIQSNVSAVIPSSKLLMLILLPLTLGKSRDGCVKFIYWVKQGKMIPCFKLLGTYFIGADFFSFFSKQLTSFPYISHRNSSLHCTWPVTNVWFCKMQVGNANNPTARSQLIC